MNLNGDKVKEPNWYYAYCDMKRHVAPQIKYSQDLYEELLRDFVSKDTVWLDAGCGHKILPEWRFESEREIVKRAACVCGTDGDFKSVRQHRSVSNINCANLQYLPYRDEVFNLVTCNMVVEHLADPTGVFLEFRRVLKPSGVLIIHTPNLLGYCTMASAWMPESIKGWVIQRFKDKYQSQEREYYPTLYIGPIRDSDSRRWLAALDFRKLRLICGQAMLPCKYCHLIRLVN